MAATTILNRQQFSNHSSAIVNLHGSVINVTVTSFASVVDEWINTTLSLGNNYLLRRALIVGMSMDHGVNTLHLCVARRCLIFQLSQADYIPLSLCKFLLNNGCRFAGFWNRWHRWNLYSKYGLLMYIDPFDLRWLKPGHANDSMEEMVYKCLGMKVEQKEEIKTGNWSEKVLSDDQVVYACVEAYCAFIFGRNFKLCGI